MAQEKLRIGVTPAGYDDIGAIIKTMGYDYALVPLVDLAVLARLKQYDVVFVNCASPCRGQGPKEAPALKTYVAEGGVLYASDFASDYIAAAFPEHVAFGNFDGAARTVKAQVDDLGLQDLLGKQIPLVFDLSSWRTVAKVTKAQVHLSDNGRPLLVSFDYKKGHVVYTCFHNKKALSGQAESDLLRYLVLKPLTARAAMPAKAGVNLDLAREHVFVLAPGGAEVVFEYPTVGGEPLVFALSWTGAAVCELKVSAPDGSEQRQEGANSPLQLTIPLSGGGAWRAHARALKGDQSGIAAHLLMGPPRLDQPVVSQTQPLDIRVLSVQELPIKVLKTGELPPLNIRRLDQE